MTGLTLGNYSIFVVGFGAEGDPVLPSTHSETVLIIIGWHCSYPLKFMLMLQCYVFVQMLLKYHLFQPLNPTRAPSGYHGHPHCSLLLSTE